MSLGGSYWKDQTERIKEIKKGLWRETIKTKGHLRGRQYGNLIQSKLPYRSSK